MLGLSKATRNICQLGTIFFFHSFPFYTLSALAQTIVEKLSKVHNISEHAGYYSSFISYLIFTFGHFVATPIVEIITPKWSVLVGLVGYALYEASFLYVNEVLLYLAAAFVGFSGSLLWTGQFDYLSQNCQPHTLDRNASTLWGLSQISLMVGGLYLLILYRFQDGDDFQLPLIHLVICSFLACSILASFICLFLPKPAFQVEKYKIPYFAHLSEIVKITFDRNVLFLLFTFVYTGMEASFFSGIFPTMVSFTQKLGNNRDMNAWALISVGVGNVTASSLLSSLGKRVREIGRKKMVVMGVLLHITCFALCFMTFPNECSLKPTPEQSYFAPSALIVLVCGWLLGVGDTIINQQCYTILSDIFEHDKRIEGFAVYRFFQSAAGCVMMLSFISYLIFTFGHFVATPIVEIITPKWSVLVGLVGYALYEMAFLWINEYFLYFSAAFSGFSGSLLWTGQFDYLAQNTQPHTLDRNSSILWGLSQISLILGGCYLLLIYRFQSGDEFQMPLIRLVVTSFLACTVVSIFIGVFLPKPVYTAEKQKIPYLQHLYEILKVSTDRNLLLLFFTFCYTGMETSFFTVVFPTMISFTRKLGSNRDMNAYTLICVGVGNVTGSLALSILGARVRELGRKNMVLLAVILHISSFSMIFLTFPDESSLKPTEELGYYPPRALIVLICAFFLGVGDTIVNQQCYTILSDIFEHDKRIEAFAVYRFFQSAAGCVVMFYATQVYLKTHIFLLTFFAVMSSITFCGIRIPKGFSLPASSEQVEDVMQRN
ncbi:unnamed protein product [Caenorhabditis sp. 36 PRJEB53466]|nr:unnamed protein product [Caenorhabditis sp. 36 PRJEB53466]